MGDPVSVVCIKIRCVLCEVINVSIEEGLVHKLSSLERIKVAYDICTMAFSLVRIDVRHVDTDFF